MSEGSLKSIPQGRVGASAPGVPALACVLALLLMGCGSGSKPSSKEAADSTLTAADSSTTPSYYVEDSTLTGFMTNVAKPWTGDFDGMVKRRMIRVLVVHNQTNYFFDGLRPRGITYEALVEFERELNEKFRTRHLKVFVIHIPVSREHLIPMLLSGHGDIAAANLTITPERSREVAFSAPAVSNVSEVVVSRASAPALATLEDLIGREVWVRPSSSYHASLLALNRRFLGEGRDTVLIRPADERLETEDLLEMVSAGLIDVTIADSHLATFWGDVLDSLRVYPNLTVRTGANIAWAFRQGSPKLEEQVNRFIRRHGEGQSIGNTLLKRYLKTNRWARNPTAGAERRRFANTAEMFKRYAAKYDFDWLMIAAQAFQESKLDQKLVSPAGAVGVMQLLPSTAAGPGVHIKDIKKVENNIHAGVKYMRFIHDQYFADAPMNDVDRHLFAFASYNAGPNRIASLRRKAQAQGLDPNVWFQNVEVIAAREIGRETVQYVSNIFKYYLAYKLALERELESKSKQAAMRP